MGGNYLGNQIFMFLFFDAFRKNNRPTFVNRTSVVGLSKERDGTEINISLDQRHDIYYAFRTKSS